MGHDPPSRSPARASRASPAKAPVHSDADIETAVIALAHEPGGGLVALPEVFTFEHRAPIISAAARANVPAVYASHQSVKDGGLLSYARGVSRVGWCSQCRGLPLPTRRPGRSALPPSPTMISSDGGLGP